MNKAPIRKNDSHQSTGPNLGLVWNKFLLLESLHIQSLHMLANICPLADIAITPEILPPPLQLSPNSSIYADSIVHQVLPYMPDWPEFMAAYSVKHVNVADLFKGDLNIALIGKPGIGKTTALAYLALLIINNDPKVQYLGKSLPIFIHARDIVEASSNPDPIQILARILSDYYPEIKPDKLKQLLDTSFQSNQVILLIDGIDELPRNLIKDCYMFINSINHVVQSKYRLMITAPLDYLDGFALENVAPVAMGIWNSNSINTFIGNIVHIFNKYQDQPVSEVNEQLLCSSLRSWISQGHNHFTPLEITIQSITMLNGAETGKSSFDIMNSFIDYVVPNKSLRNSLEVLAYQTLISENPIINKYEMNHYVPELVSHEDSEVISSGTVNPKKAFSLKSRGIILKETIKGNTIFSSPIYLGFLASNAVIRNGQFQSIFDQREWAGKETALSYLTHLIDISQYLDFHDVDNDSPLQSKLFTYAHWLGECKSASIWRPQILKRLAQVMNTDSLPVTIRAKAMAALCFSNEKGIESLFHSYLLSGYPTVRLLASLGCGILRDPISINRLADLLADQNVNVRISACMALYGMDREDTLEFIVKILLQADENLRRAVAEMLTLNPFEGHPVLADAISHQDIMVRRAVVFGLGLMRNKWSYDLLQKLQIQEGQWVVRTAAAQALELAEGTDPCIPRRLEEPYLCPWLIQAASNTGEGISPGIPPIPLFLKLLDEGSDEEKFGVLEYLVTNDTEAIIARIYDVMFSSQNQVREAAFYTLWKMSLSGAEFPSTKKYGYH